MLTNSPTRDGFERIYYPGEIEAGTYGRRMAEGIPIDGHTQEMFKELAEQFGIDEPQVMEAEARHETRYSTGKQKLSRERK